MAIVERITVNPMIFNVTAKLEQMEADHKPKYEIENYRRHHQDILEKSVLAGKISLKFLRKFDRHLVSWQKHICIPLGEGKMPDMPARKVIWILASVEDEHVRPHDENTIRSFKRREDNVLSPTLVQTVKVLLGETYHEHELVFLITATEVVHLAIDKFYVNAQLDSVIETESEDVIESSVVLIDAKATPELDRAAVERGQGWLRTAINRDATDIHIEPIENGGRVRLRIDGRLEESEPFIATTILRQVISWIKVQADVDITEQRKALDGKMKLARNVRGTRYEVDVRYSSIPTIHGEKVVLRLLDKSKQERRYEQGKLRGVFPPGSEGDVLYTKFEDAVRYDNGIVLVTGPTGSGKTTTLNTALRHLLDVYRDTLNIVTVEDPVEYTIAGANQVQTNDQAELTFANALRSLLRQDPDIILVGEIRDAETASIAVQASLTGHLILSTLHTNDAIGCVERLADLGVSRFLIGSTVRLFQAQRLIRLLCKECRIPQNTVETQGLIHQSRLDGWVIPAEGQCIHKANTAGLCEVCSGKGYKGRQAVMEVIPMTAALRMAIQKNSTRQEMLQVASARECGFRPMVQTGVDLMFRGMTDIPEVEDLVVDELPEQE